MKAAAILMTCLILSGCHDSGLVGVWLDRCALKLAAAPSTCQGDMATQYAFYPDGKFLVTIFHGQDPLGKQHGEWSTWWGTLTLNEHIDKRAGGETVFSSQEFTYTTAPLTINTPAAQVSAELHLHITKSKNYDESGFATVAHLLPSEIQIYLKTQEIEK